MKAAVKSSENDGSVVVAEMPTPTAGSLTDRGILIEVHHSGVNRADLLQCRGLYPPPPGESELLGLEASGVISAVGAQAKAEGWRPGQLVMALLGSGGNAEFALADMGCVLSVPESESATECMSMAEAGAFMETFLTAYLNVYQLGGLAQRLRAAQKTGRTLRVLLHGASGGVGTSLLRLLAADEAWWPEHKIWATAGSDSRCQRVRQEGADEAINYHTQDFAQAAQDAGVQFDLILDCIGGKYLADHLQVIAPDGRLVVIGLMGGARAELDLAMLLHKRVQIFGSTLRPLDRQIKAEVLKRFSSRFATHIANGSLKPLLEESFDLNDISLAHRCMRTGEYFGKIGINVN